MQSSLSAALEQAHPREARACHAELDTRSGFLGLTEVGIIDQMEEIAPMLSVTAVFRDGLDALMFGCLPLCGRCYGLPAPRRTGRPPGCTKKDTRMRRRHVLAALAATGTTRGASGQPAGRPLLRVWRDPNCGCCTGWVEHMRAAGFQVEDNLVASAAPVRRMLGIPPDLLSCHAGLIEGYALEGHVPAQAVLRLLGERPAGLRGLAVPAMPTGSPGMEVPGEPDDTYDVVAFDGTGGRRAYMRFRGSRPV